ncbi:MAG: magnesium transporter CorA family protein [bacterium]|nr:magnesium transporter CorA family protein [bacterium]
MMFRFEREGTHWIDLENPTADEVREAAHELGFGGRIIEELISPSPLPLVLHEEPAALLVLHFPSLVTGARSASQTPQKEVDFVVGKHFVLTVRYEVVAPLHELRRLLETNTLLGKNARTPADALLELLFNHLYGNIRIEVSQAGRRLERIEQELFAGKESTTVRAISEISREFLHLEATIAGEEDALTLFLDDLSDKEIFGPSFTPRSKRILAQHAQTAHFVATLRAVAAELRETNAALLNTKQNEIMQRLTVVTFMLLPLSLIVNMFEMNLPGVPFSTHPQAFWVIVGIMCIVAGVLIFFFTRKRWL